MLISFPPHALLIVEERLKEQEAKSVRMPEGMPVDELALQILIAAALKSRVDPHPVSSTQPRSGLHWRMMRSSRISTADPYTPEGRRLALRSYRVA